jgi:hypothetical protein
MHITQLEPRLIQIEEFSKYNGQKEKVSVAFRNEDNSFRIFPLGKYLRRTLVIDNNLIIEGADATSNLLFWYSRKLEKCKYIPLRGEILGDSYIKLKEGLLQLLTCYRSSYNFPNSGYYLKVLKLETDFYGNPSWSLHKKIDFDNLDLVED